MARGFGLIRTALGGFAALMLSACAGGEARLTAPSDFARPSTGMVRPGTPPEVDIVRARQAGREQLFEWHAWSAETFELARRENRLILVDGAAAWCHWCHVMDETTYRDPEVGRLLRDRFVAIRVDIDERPDLAERYGDWGWPATIVLSSEAQELGKFQGYLEPARLAAILADVVESPKEALPSALDSTARVAADPGDVPATESELPWIVASMLFELDEYYDDERGGWGRRQKAPLGENLELEARRAARGDVVAKRRVLQTVAAQRALIDPVWGGVYQYSVGGVWNDPHFEKLMTYQATNLEGYAEAFRVTGEPAAKRDARDVARYVTSMLSGAEGTFFVSQDADVYGHDAKSPFIDGHVYYGKDDAGRRALGMPRIDDHVYAFENGLAIAALVSLHEKAGDPNALSQARKAADRLRATHVMTDGTVRHDAQSTNEVRFLADAASLGRAYARLATVTGDTSYRDVATRIGAAMLRNFATDGADLFANTPDSHAIGVFAKRRRPFEGNVLAARFLAELARVTGDDVHRRAGLRILAAVSTPRSLSKQGRNLGGYLLAADELGLMKP